MLCFTFSNFWVWKPQTYKEVARRIHLDLSVANSLPWLAFSYSTKTHSPFCWTICGAALDLLPFLLQILQHACPKNKAILFHNHNVILHLEDIALIDYIMKCPYSHFHNCSTMSLLTSFLNPGSSHWSHIAQTCHLFGLSNVEKSSFLVTMIFFF